MGLLRRIAISNCHKMLKNLATRLLALGDQATVDEWNEQLELEIEQKAARQTDGAGQDRQTG